LFRFIQWASHSYSVGRDSNKDGLQKGTCFVESITMAEQIDEKTQVLLTRLSNGEEASQFTEIEKSNMVYAWRRHLLFEVLPPWLMGVTLFLFLSLAGSLGFLLNLIVCALLFMGVAGASGWLYEKIATRFSYDDLLKPTKSWAIQRAAAAKKEKTRSIPYFWIAVGVLSLIAVFTVPDKARHEAEIRNAVSEEISRFKAESLGDAAAKWLVSAIHQNLQDDPKLSYIDTMGYQYGKLLIFSSVRTRPENGQDSEFVSVGFFNQVYVFNREKN
jgi:hypothetical protein